MEITCPEEMCCCVHWLILYQSLPQKQIEEEKERKKQAKKEERAQKRKNEKEAASKNPEPTAKKARQVKGKHCYYLLNQILNDLNGD